MFPSNLHRNIVQLDRQISLLENECKNIEIEKKKKAESSYSASSKISSARLKSPTVKVTVKKTDSSIRSKKPTLPVSTRLQSSSSLPLHYTKTWSEIGNNLVGKRKKPCGLSKNVPLCPRQMIDNPHYNSKKENQFIKCICGNEIPASDLASGEGFEEGKKDHVLHKELVFPNSGGAIEVTVTQKSNNERENSPVTQNSTIKKSLNSENQIDKDIEVCKCQVKGQKWSEILCEKSSKRKESNSGKCMKNKFHAVETKTTHKSMNFMNNKKPEENFSCKHHSDNIQVIPGEGFEIPVKLNSPSNRAKGQAELNCIKFEKETQCSSENCCFGQHGNESKIPQKIFQFLLYICQQIPTEVLKKLPIEVETVSVIKEALTEICVENKNSNDIGQNNSAHISPVKHNCEKLIKEKTLLSQEILAKDNAMATMRKREDEYLLLIDSLKTNLEKLKGNAQENIDAVKEMNIIKNKLFEQVKVSEALKKGHLKLQEIMEKCSLENDRLKTQIKIFQLEAQKHEVLLAGKEVEIKRYREEIQNFQRQISEHLSALKSNAQAMDVEKMMEAIVQQSQIFAQTDLDALLEKDQKNSPKVQNILMHSSPTSTKTSNIDSSWKQISSIHDHDQSKANSDVVIYLNDENNSKDFFQIFGENSFSELITPKKSKKPVEKSSTDKKEIKNSSSFTSCLSINDEHNTSKSTNRDSLISKGSLISVGDKSDEELRKSRVSLEKAQSTIDELLKNMKLKFSKEIFETSSRSYTTEDFLDISQISSISLL